MSLIDGVVLNLSIAYWILLENSCSD